MEVNMTKKINYSFVAFPSLLAESNVLSVQDKAVFLYLLSNSHRNWNPSYRELSQKLSLGNSTIRRSIVKLHLLGFITARTSIRGKTYKNEINEYRVNLMNPSLWCPTLDLKEEIERCYEINRATPPIFVYIDYRKLEMDIRKALDKGIIVRTEATLTKTAEQHFSTDIPLEYLTEYEVHSVDFRRINIWQSCVGFSNWLNKKSGSLSSYQQDYFKNRFIDDNLSGDKRKSLREALLTLSHSVFLAFVETDKEKTRTNKASLIKAGE
jgi:hypothetical protein